MTLENFLKLEEFKKFRILFNATVNVDNDVLSRAKVYNQLLFFLASV